MFLEATKTAATTGADEYCHAPVSTACRLVWDVSHSATATRWYSAWLDNDGLITVAFKLILTLVVALLLRRLIHRMISKATRRMATGTIPDRLREKTHTIFQGTPVVVSERRRQRSETMGSVLRSIASIIILGTAALMMAGYLGLDLAPILASASVVGIAVGFGAQNLVKDFISGIFMLIEDQYGVGDMVDLGDASGTVEAVSLRTTRLRDVNGVVWYVRNGEISRVGNESQNWARAVLDVPVKYGEDVDQVKTVLQTTARAMADDERWRGKILAEPDVWGVQALSGEAIVVRLVVKTAPGEQSPVARALREEIKKAFDSAGVTIATFKTDTSAA